MIEAPYGKSKGTWFRRFFALAKGKTEIFRATTSVLKTLRRLATSQVVLAIFTVSPRFCNLLTDWGMGRLPQCCLCPYFDQLLPPLNVDQVLGFFLLEHLKFF